MWWKCCFQWRWLMFTCLVLIVSYMSCNARKGKLSDTLYDLIFCSLPEVSVLCPFYTSARIYFFPHAFGHVAQLKWKWKFSLLDSIFFEWSILCSVWQIYTFQFGSLVTGRLVNISMVWPVRSWIAQNFNTLVHVTYGIGSN